jgi:murein DD-endopeptidase MepM/ murein hydrolase activator NlpD
MREQIAREAERNRRALASVRPEKEWELPLLRPVGGGVSSAFGGRRVVNGEPRSPHRGTDLRGAEGTPVRASAAGTVLLAEPQYFSGNVIFLDHGLGVVSSYAHLSSFDVRPGDRVERGQAIGKVGATGRVTGPHLHLGLFIQGIAVDAVPLFSLPLRHTGGPTREDPRPPAAPATPTGTP